MRKHSWKRNISSLTEVNNELKQKILIPTEACRFLDIVLTLYSPITATDRVERLFCQSDKNWHENSRDTMDVKQRRQQRTLLGISWQIFGSHVEMHIFLFALLCLCLCAHWITCVILHVLAFVFVFKSTLVQSNTIQNNYAIISILWL